MKEIRHIGIYVNDIEKMRDFYVDVLGMKVKTHDIEKSDFISTVLGIENAEIELYKLIADDGSMIELLKYKSNIEKHLNKKIWETGTSHIAFTVSDIETEHERLKKIGIEFISKPRISSNGYAKVCFCKDPEGNHLELVEVL